MGIWNLAFISEQREYYLFNSTTETRSATFCVCVRVARFAVRRTTQLETQSTSFSLFMMNNNSSTTIKEGVETPHAHDVLCGRGGYANFHEGNRNWRRLVQANKDLYAALPKFQKQLLSQSIVNAVQAQSPPGRFLYKDLRCNLWFPVEEAKAVDKTSQALREGGRQIQEQDEDKDKGDNEPEVVKVKPPPIQLPPIHLAVNGDQMPTSIDIYMPSTEDETKVPKNAKVQPAPNPPVTSHSQQQHGNIAYGYGGEQQGVQYQQQQQYHPSMPHQGMGQPQQQMGMGTYYVPVPHSVLSQQPSMQPSLHHVLSQQPSMQLLYHDSKLIPFLLSSPL